MFIASTSTQCIRAILDRKDIPYSHKIIMVAISMNHDYRHRCEVGIEIIRAQAGMSQRTIYRALAKMEELGFVTKEKVGGGKSIYRNDTCGWGEMAQ